VRAQGAEAEAGTEARMSMMGDGDLEMFGGEGVNDDDAAGDVSGDRELTVGALALKTAPNTSATAITREQRRSRRKREIRARTISVKRMTKRELEIGRMLYPETDYYKPKTRAECADGPRPCPYVSCQHHLFLDVSARTGAIKLNFPDLEVWDMNETCALDVADRGGTTLEDVGAIMNLTRERIRQVEVKALAKLEALKDTMALRDYVDEGPVGKRRLPVLRTPVADDDDLDEEIDEDEEIDADDADHADDADDADDADEAPETDEADAATTSDALTADFDGAE
jgi:hypothetical protein